MDADARPVRALPVAPDVPDAELVERALGGERWAEDAIFRRHAPYLAGIAFRLLSDGQDGQDVVHDTFVYALHKLTTLRNPSALRPWLAQIAVNRIRSEFRRRRLLRFFGLASDDTLPLAESNSTPPEAAADIMLIEQVVRHLPVDEATAWILRHVEGDEMNDVALALGCSLATAKRRLAAAEARIRRHVATVGEGQ